MAHHELHAAPGTVHWGFFDASLPPVLRIRSGDRLTLSTLSGIPGDQPPERERVPPELWEIHREVPKGEGPHILTGPVFVEEAEEGDVLEVHIEEVRPRLDWGYNRTLPGLGTLPDDFPRLSRTFFEIDRDSMTAGWLKGVRIPLRPFFGILGVAPPPRDGRIPSVPPGRHGGNLDNKELAAGSTVYLPVWNRGALLSIGDGHAVQGDGEVDLTALETAMFGRFRIRVRKGLGWKSPRAETPAHYITMGFNPDLDEAAREALREMIDLIATRWLLDREDAYRLCSLVVDVRITQLVNRNKGAHAMLPKGILPEDSAGEAGAGPIL